MSTEINFLDRAACEQAQKDIRSDDNDTNWMVLSYIEGSNNDVELTGSGNGGITELHGALDENKRQYAFLRVVDFVDGYKTDKFVFFTWAGEKVSVVKKARMATQKGSIEGFMGQVHISMNASTVDDMTEEIVMGRVMDASGSASHVMDARERLPEETYTAIAPSEVAPAEDLQPSKTENTGYRGAQAAYSLPSNATRLGGRAHPTAVRNSKEVQFPDRDAINSAISSVRADSDPTQWAILGYDGNSDDVVLVGTGSDGIDGLKSKFTADTVQYALFRTEDQYDQTVNVKFVLIIWIGEEVRLVRKARIATHKGAITEAIGQFHVDITAQTLDEVNMDDITAAVQKASGTANYVM